jgi:hypothetical protein
MPNPSTLAADDAAAAAYTDDDNIDGVAGTRLEKILALIRAGGIVAVFMPEEVKREPSAPMTRDIATTRRTFIVNVFDGKEHRIQRIARQLTLDNETPTNEMAYERLWTLTSLGQQVTEYIYNGVTP